MLMGDKYLVWVGPGGVTCTWIVLEHKMQYVMKTFSFKYMQNVFNQKMNNKEISFFGIDWGFSQTVCSFARERVCGFPTQMQCGRQPCSSRTTVLERNISCCSSLMERWDTQYLKISARVSWSSYNMLKHQCPLCITLNFPQQEPLTFFSTGRRCITQWCPPLISHRWGTPTSWRGKMI